MSGRISDLAVYEANPAVFHDPKVLYVAANKVFRSADRGMSWTAVSPDLTTGTNRDEIMTMGIKNSEIRVSRNDGIAAWNLPNTA